jgi:hypothetical protein
MTSHDFALSLLSRFRIVGRHSAVAAAAFAGVALSYHIIEEHFNAGFRLARNGAVSGATPRRPLWTTSRGAAQLRAEFRGSHASESARGRRSRLITSAPSGVNAG